MLELKEISVNGRFKNDNGERNCASCGVSGISEISGFCPACAAVGIKFEIPKEHEFEEHEYLIAPELAAIASRLIKTYDDFSPVAFADFTYLFTYLWKLTGGKTGGKNKLGACQKPSGLLKHYAETDFIIWLAADHCFRYNEYQITALIFHELKHAGYNPENGKYEIITHDFEGFNREVEIFGAWKSDVYALGNAFKTASQPNLFE